MTTPTGTTPTGYSRTQIALHWGVAGLVAAQYLFKDSIAEAWDAYTRGQDVVFQPLILARVAGGTLILALVLWRLVLRARRGVPPPPETEPAALKTLAKAAHLAFYAVLIGMSLSGALAWIAGLEAAAGLHNLLKAALLALIVLHVLAVAVHQRVFRTAILRRMNRAGP